MSKSSKDQLKEDDTGFKRVYPGHPDWHSFPYNGSIRFLTWGRPFRNARWASGILGPQAAAAASESSVTLKGSLLRKWRWALMATCLIIAIVIVTIVALFVSGVVPKSSPSQKNLSKYINSSFNEDYIDYITLVEEVPKSAWTTGATVRVSAKSFTVSTNNSNSLPSFLSNTLSVDVSNGGNSFWLRDESTPVPLAVTSCLDFYSFHEEVAAAEGKPQESSINNVEACKEVCDNDLSCTAFSFDRNTAKCSIVTSQPNSLINSPGVTFYIRHGCHYCLLFEKRERTHAYGGQEQGREINTEEKCFSVCSKSLTCWGFDFARDSSLCYLHFSVISEVPTTGNIVQYGRIGCDPDCSSGYSVNSGIDVIDSQGLIQRYVRDLPTCRGICDSQVLCQAFSFRFNDNTCRIFLNVITVITSNPWSTLYNKPFCTVNKKDGKFPVRLVGSRSNAEGRLEIQYKGRWGTVCDDHFTDVEAALICKQLGFSLPARSVGGAFYGQAPANTPIWLDDLHCNATSESLKNCTSRGWGFHNCRHHEDVGVACGAAPSLDWQVRLNGGRSSQEGHVQVRLNDTSPWFYVCDDYWEYVDSDVICKQLGLGNYSYAFTNSNFGRTDAQFLLDDVRCDSEMTNLRQCSHRGLYTHDCRSHEIAGVQCFYQSQDRPSTNVRLTQGVSPMQGRLEVYYNAEWGTVCDDSFDNVDASVICRELGFRYGRTKPCCQTFSQGSGKIWLDSVECDQDDRSIFDCKHDGWGRHDCTHGEDVGLECYEDLEIRLVDGATASEGRVEVKHQGQWGTVCDDSFGNDDAVVLCRMLGYVYGEVKKFGIGQGRIWLDEVQCNGNEREIYFCDHNNWGEHNCSHAEDVGIICFYRSPTNLKDLSPALNSSMIKISEGLIEPALFSRVDQTCYFDVDLCDMEATGWKQYSNFKVDSRIRLVGGANPKEGRVEVYNQGEWGTICHNGWDDDDATAVCKMFGYQAGTAACCNRFGPGPSRVWLDQVDCNRNAASLWQCFSPGWGNVSNCGNGASAGVLCSGEKPTPTFDVTYLGTDMTSPVSTLLMEVTSSKCVHFMYRMPKGLYIYFAPANSEAFTPFTFNPIKAGGLVITERTNGIEWKKAELSISTGVRYVFLVTMATNGSQIHVTNMTVTQSSCAPFACPTGMRKCKLVQQCYSEEAHCDGIYDCLDSSDENYCQTPYYDCVPPKSSPSVPTPPPAAPTLLPPSRHCVEKTQLGNSNGAICYFPFIFEGKSYNNCTSEKHHTEWCATTDNFDRDKKWGNCDGCVCPEKTITGENCVFPFIFKGQTFHTCTTLEYTQRWCSVTPVYSGKWGICEGCSNNTITNTTLPKEDEPCVPYTRKGNSDGAQCFFPFIYKGSQYWSCTTQDHPVPWCAVVPNYDVHKKWGLCAGCTVCRETTILGNDGGKRCAIPFIFKGVQYNSCTNVEYHSFWCSTTSNYDLDKKWGVCNGGCDDEMPKEKEEEDGGGTNGGGTGPNGFVVSAVSCRELTTGGNAQGEKCIFPFLYQGVIYRSCTTIHHHRPWCAVTFNYDRDGFWGNCIGCPVKDAIDQNSPQPSKLVRPGGEDGTNANTIAPACSAKIHSFNSGSLDGALQKNSDVIKWKNIFGNTPTNGTGPSLSRDYLPMTLFTFAKLNMAFQDFSKKIDLVIPTSTDGKYVYAEMSTGVPGDSGTLSFTVPLGSLYLRFHYHMSGRQVGSLSVAIDDKVIWNVKGDQSNDLKTSEEVGYPSSWRFAQVILPSGAAKVDFTAKKGNGPLGDIAIDNVAFAYKHPYSDLSCPTNFYRCGDANCIPKNFLCDGVRHCSLNEDETGCLQPTCPTGFYNLCADRRCLPGSAKCDNIVDCEDNSDETSCGIPLPSVGSACDGFTCTNGQCVGSQYKCDQIDHCSDGSDEICASSTALFHCSYGQVLKLKERCDGTAHCFDASDEADCGTCAKYTLACGNFCVPPDKICNNFPDCSTGGDEGGSCECRGDQFLCDGKKCISRENVCDGKRDCSDGSDEPAGCQCQPLFQMTCGDGTCVGWSKRCDLNRDCGDYSDEIGCGACKPGWRKCDVDYCVMTSQWCDGISHCPDSSDEKINCTCEADQFACGDRCVPLSNRCDNKIDCGTSLDEIGCSCSPNEKPCNNGVCISDSYFCNGFFECEDSSDEFQCKCAPGQFSCTNGLCISASRRCNRFDNCGDESDEIGCPCQENEFICNSTGRCISREYRCDGVRDCANGEDEKDCAPRGPASCSPSEIPCNLTCVPLSYRCNGEIDCTEIPAGADETKCIKQQAVSLHNSIAYAIFIEKQGQNYVICYDRTSWTDQWGQAVCQQLGQGPFKSLSEVSLTQVGNPRSVLFVDGPLGQFLQKSLTARDKVWCGSSQAVAILCHPAECGERAKHLNIPDTLIVGGEMSQPGMWPWQVQVKVGGVHVCGATLLNAEWAVTASHCVVEETLTKYIVTMGSIYRTEADPQRQTRYLAEIVRHPKYNGSTFENDIALLKLGLPVTLTDYVLPACLPHQDEEPAYRDECQVIGWGRLSDGNDTVHAENEGITPERLRDARFTIWSDLRCKSYHSTYQKTSMICAGETRNFASACYGDSGGPLVCRDANNRWTLTGIVSWAATPCKAPPTFYTRVASYRTWIALMMSKYS